MRWLRSPASCMTGEDADVVVVAEPADRLAMLREEPRAELARFRPEPGKEGGAGIYLLHQVCDLSQLRSGPAGTTARVAAWR